MYRGGTEEYLRAQLPIFRSSGARHAYTGKQREIDIYDLDGAFLALRLVKDVRSVVLLWVCRDECRLLSITQRWGIGNGLVWLWAWWWQVCIYKIVGARGDWCVVLYGVFGWIFFLVVCI